MWKEIVCYDCGKVFLTEDDKMCLCEKCRKNYKSTGLFRRGLKVKNIGRKLFTGMSFHSFQTELRCFVGISICFIIYMIVTVFILR